MLRRNGGITTFSWSSQLPCLYMPVLKKLRKKAKKLRFHWCFFSAPTTSLSPLLRDSLIQQKWFPSVLCPLCLLLIKHIGVAGTGRPADSPRARTDFYLKRFLSFEWFLEAALERRRNQFLILFLPVRCWPLDEIRIHLVNLNFLSIPFGFELEAENKN